MAVSASECAASAAIAAEPVTTAAPTLASATPRLDPRDTNTVRVLSSGIARPPLSLATAQGVLDRLRPILAHAWRAALQWRSGRRTVLRIPAAVPGLGTPVHCYQRRGNVIDASFDLADNQYHAK